MSRHWRMEKSCADCPFNKSGPGLRLRKSLSKGRWRAILRDLRQQKHFTCHKTTDETGDGSNLVCAGAIAWQEKQGVSSQYVRIAERLDYFRRERLKGESDGELAKSGD